LQSKKAAIHHFHDLMKAMILAAGLGTRLLPLTASRPKALMPVVNKPVIGRIIEYLRRFGITQIIVNAHHHHEQLIDYLDRGRPFGLEIEVRVEPEILGTGGGIRNTEDFWDKAPFPVINGDILTSINLYEVYESHVSSGALATMVLHDREPFNQITIDHDCRITDIAQGNMPGRLAFTGIHFVQPEFLPNIPKGEFSDIIACYREMIRSGGPIKAYVARGHYWFDVGTIEAYVEANKKLLKEPFAIAHDCSIGPGARLEQWAVLGRGTALEKDVRIGRSILWEQVLLKEGTRIMDSIVTSSRVVDRDLMGEIF